MPGCAELRPREEESILTVHRKGSNVWTPAGPPPTLVSAKTTSGAMVLPGVKRARRILPQKPLQDQADPGTPGRPCPTPPNSNKSQNVRAKKYQRMLIPFLSQPAKDPDSNHVPGWTLACSGFNSGTPSSSTPCIAAHRMREKKFANHFF